MANTTNANSGGMSAGGQGEQAAHSREIKDVQKEIKSGAGAGKKRRGWQDPGQACTQRPDRREARQIAQWYTRGKATSGGFSMNNTQKLELVETYVKSGIFRNCDAQTQAIVTGTYIDLQRAVNRDRATILAYLHTPEGRAMAERMLSPRQQQSYGLLGELGELKNTLTNLKNAYEHMLAPQASPSRPGYGAESGMIIRSAAYAAPGGGRINAGGVHPRQTTAERRQCGCWLCMR
jgi:hypothetical protein